MCAYFAKLAFNDTGLCKLCKTEEESRTHIFIFCEITLKVYEYFLCYTDKILNIGPVDLIERAFGLREEEENEKRIKLRNYVNFTVRHIIFRNCNRNLGASDATVVTNICKKVVSFIQKDLNLKLSKISLSGRASFVENY